MTAERVSSSSAGTSAATDVDRPRPHRVHRGRGPRGAPVARRAGASSRRASSCRPATAARSTASAERASRRRLTRFVSEWRGLEPGGADRVRLPARGRGGGAAPLPRRVGARLHGARGERGPRAGPAGAPARTRIRARRVRFCTGSSSRRSPRASACARRRRSRGILCPSCRSGSSSRRRCSATSPSGRSCVLGAGETGSLFARQAVEAGVRDLRIANRTDETARESSPRACRAPPSPGRTTCGSSREADVVVGTTASPRPVVRRDARRERHAAAARTADVLPRPRRASRRRRRSPGRLQRVRLRGERPRGAWREENRKRRAREMPSAEEILEDELAKFLVWMDNLVGHPDR